MKRMKLISILCACLVLLLGVGYAYASSSEFSGGALLNQDAEATAIPQSVATLGSLTVSTSGSGTLVPAAETSLGFQEGGVLVEMNVGAGAQVKAGEVLARLQIDKTPNELAAELASAELAVIEARQALDELTKNAGLKAAQALTALEEAQQTLENLKDDSTEQATAQQALAKARQAVSDAEMQVYILNSSPTQEAKDIAHASLLFKEKELQEMEKRIARLENQIKIAPNHMVWDMLRGQLQNLKIELLQMQGDYEKRLYRYEHMDDPADPVEVAAAQAQLTTAQAQLVQAQQDWEEAQAGATPGDLAQAESDLAEAQAEWERWKDGPDPQEIAQAEAQLSIAQAQLAIVQGEKLVVDLVAPYDGVVLSVSAHEGDRLNGGTLLTLADVSQPLVEVYVDETEMDYARVGNKAQVVFDAFPDRTFAGQVVEVDPSLTEVGGVNAVRALVRLDETPSSSSQTMPVGLNATVDLIAGQVSDAVLVPLEALHETSPGKYAVYVVQGNALELRQVSVGLKDYTTAEITKGLSAGEAVALGAISNAETAKNTEGEQ